MPGSFNSANDGLWTRGLLIRRRIADDDLAFFTNLVPGRNSHRNAGRGRRPSLGDRGQFLRPPKNEFGLDHNESRSWHGWHRPRVDGDARLRHDGGDPPSCQSAAAKKKTQRRTTAKTKNHRRLVIDTMVNPGSSAHRHQASLESGSSPPTSSHGHSGAELTRRSLGVRTSKQNGNCNASITVAFSEGF